MSLGCAIALAIVIFFACSPEGFGPVLLVGLPLLALLNYFPARGLGNKVVEKARALRSLPYDALLEMRGEEYVTVAARQAHIAVIVEQESPDTLRVVVRGIVVSGFLLAQYTRFDGFFRSRDGTLEPMANSEFDKYEVILG